MTLLGKTTLNFHLIFCFIGFLIGLFLLLILITIIPSKNIQIKQIDETLTNQRLTISGEIITIKSFEKSNFQIISLKDKTGRIDITTNKILLLKINQSIQVTGRVTEYNSALQLQADKIVLMN
ncbi:MAG: OB-fold nucleic acid binding domain-containing protein [Candidatus Pacearchaeota archaeon]|jgi:DNA/RNA endonuclease YhcR with UshA esterase domain